MLARSLNEKKRVGEHKKIEVEKENYKSDFVTKRKTFSRRKRTHDCA